MVAGTKGYLDDVEVPHIRAFETDLHKWMKSERAALLDDIRKASKKPQMEEADQELVAAIEKFKGEWKAPTEKASE